MFAKSWALAEGETIEGWSRTMRNRPPASATAQQLGARHEPLARSARGRGAQSQQKIAVCGPRGKPKPQAQQSCNVQVSHASYIM